MFSSLYFVGCATGSQLYSVAMQIMQSSVFLFWLSAYEFLRDCVVLSFVQHNSTRCQILSWTICMTACWCCVLRYYLSGTVQLNIGHYWVWHAIGYHWSESSTMKGWNWKSTFINENEYGMLLQKTSVLIILCITFTVSSKITVFWRIRGWDAGSSIFDLS